MLTPEHRCERPGPLCSRAIGASGDIVCDRHPTTGHLTVPEKEGKIVYS